MRNLTSAVLQKLAQRYGSEPINIVEVQWNKEGGNYLLYADKEIDLGDVQVDGRVMDISNLESVLKLDSNNVSQSISVQLSDTDHALKEIFDTVDIHGSVCRVSQWFPDLSWADRFQLFEGELSSPIIWSEGDKTLSFDVISKLNDKEVGFSPEDGDFNNIPDNLVGKPWPMCFGLVQNVPAVPLQEVPVVQLATATNVVDPSLEKRIAELYTLLDNLNGLINYWALVGLQAAYTCDNTGDSQACSLEQQASSMIGQLTAQYNQAREEAFQLAITLREQQDAQLDQIQVVDVKNIPQNTRLVLEINDVEFHGSFSGNTFTISERIIPDWDGSTDEPFGNIWINSGELVRLTSEKSVTYVCNIIESDVKYVQAYKSVGSVTSLTVVPSNYYSVDQVDLGDITVTAITFSRALSSVDENYADDIYVTLESTVGPNTVDEMIWLIETFSDLSYDNTSFNYVRTMIDNYPSHFAMLEQKNLLAMLEEMAFQARCSIWVNNNTVYLKYLSEELTSVATISESDIDLGTLQIYGTDTEELVTKLTCNWTDDYAKEDSNKLILRHNVKKYGSRERDIDFYIYNIGELVLKSATFWVIRLSNVWKNLHFESPLHLLKLETFDSVALSFNELNFIADSSVTGLITDLKYQSDDRTLIFDVWTPVKFGTMESYIFGWPSQIDPSYLFPTDEEIEQGYAGGNTVEVTGGFTIGDSEIRTNFQSTASTSTPAARRATRVYGEQRPSDLDDVKPTPDFRGQYAPGSAEEEWDYNYGDYGTIEPDTGGGGEEELSFSYPAVVNSGSGSTYTCSVYEGGLNEAATTAEVRQLQIAGGTIPAGTWCLVAKNQVPQRSDITGDVETDSDGNIIYTTEYSMQVPVWL